jgi:hypothetical protein
MIRLYIGAGEWVGGCCAAPGAAPSRGMGSILALGAVVTSLRVVVGVAAMIGLAVVAVRVKMLTGWRGTERTGSDRRR